MAVYLIMMAVIFGARIYRASGRPESETKDHGWLMMSWIILSLVEGFRAYSIGTDTGTYVSSFRNSTLGNFEFGFRLLNQIIRSFTNNGTVFLLVTSFLINGLVIRAIDKMSRDDAISLFCYITLYPYFTSFNIQRQYIAIGFILNAYLYLREDRIGMYALFIILGLQFHNTAVVGLILMPMIFYIRHMKRKQRMLSWYTNRKLDFEDVKRKDEATFIPVVRRLMIPIAIIFVAAVGFTIALRVLVALVPSYAYYLNSDYGTGTAAVQQKIIYSAILLAYLTFSEESEWLLMMSYAVAFSFLMSKMLMFNRFVNYFDIFSMFALAEVWHTRYISRETLTIVRICIGLACFAFMVYYLHCGVMRVTPYSSVLFKGWNYK